MSGTAHMTPASLTHPRALPGTSMACPYISGVLALFVSHSPGLKRAEYLNCLYSTATVPLLLCRS